MVYDFELDEQVRKYYSNILKKDPQRILHLASVVRLIRERADNKFYNGLINMIYPDEIILENKFMKFANNFRDYWHSDRRKEEDLEANHYRLIRLLNSNRFEEKLRVEYDDLENLINLKELKIKEHIKDIVGFVAREKILKEGGYVPVVYIRKELIGDINKFSQVKKHEDSHAFSMGFDAPEKLFGYNLDDDGEGEVIVRDKVDEYIANIEAGESLTDPCKPIFYACENKRDYNRMIKLTNKNREVIEKVKDKNKVSSMDLAAILRVIPVQIMDKVLPKVVREYESNCGLPKVEILEK